MNIIIPIVSLVATIWIFFQYIDPNYAAMKAKNEEKATYEQVLASANEAIRAKEDRVSKFNNLDQNDLEKLHVLLPDSVDPVRLIIEIDNLAKAEGMVVKDIHAEAVSPKETVKNDNNLNNLKPEDALGSLKLNFSVQGTYAHFQSFLVSLEKNLRLIDVSSASIKPVKENVYQFDFGVKTYWLK